MGANTDSPKSNLPPEVRLAGANAMVNFVASGLTVQVMSATVMPFESPTLKRSGVGWNVNPIGATSRVTEATERRPIASTERVQSRSQRVQSAFTDRSTGPAEALATHGSSGWEMGVAVLSSNRYTSRGLRLAGPPGACGTRAATAAASGAAALVPKKLGQPSPSVSSPKKDVSTPSAAVICGVKRTSGCGRRLPWVSK